MSENNDCPDCWWKDSEIASLKEDIILLEHMLTHYRRDERFKTIYTILVVVALCVLFYRC